ncbi:MAG: hypothetical protein OEQ39_25830 [Gammaproteobacteria bacterium]|nr:hypothetical protein [Gammaproteobacteria bacterium]
MESKLRIFQHLGGDTLAAYQELAYRMEDALDASEEGIKVSVAVGESNYARLTIEVEGIDFEVHVEAREYALGR